MDDASYMLSEVDRFCASWKETPIQSFNILFASKRHCALLKISFSPFFGLLLIVLLLLLLFKISLNHLSVLCGKWSLKIMAFLSAPVNVLYRCKHPVTF
jgi:hypothetical protein